MPHRPASSSVGGCSLSCILALELFDEVSIPSRVTKRIVILHAGMTGGRRPRTSTTEIRSVVKPNPGPRSGCLTALPYQGLVGGHRRDALLSAIARPRAHREQGPRPRLRAASVRTRLRGSGLEDVRASDASTRSASGARPCRLHGSVPHSVPFRSHCGTISRSRCSWSSSATAALVSALAGHLQI